MDSDAYVIQLTSAMTAKQRDVFYGIYRHRVKDYNFALLLAILTGWWIGGHRFYLNQPITGIIHILLAATTIPIFLTIIDIFRLHTIVNRVNCKIADDVAEQVRTMITE
jgi:TM2 domain-containing membrane protein YozV